MVPAICCHCSQTLSAKDICLYGLHENCFRSCEEFIDLIARSQSAPPRPESQDRRNISFFHRAYRKYSARLGKTNYILKVQQKEYPELPATEFLSNQIFRSLNIPVPDHYLIKYPDDNHCFVTKNFMSDLTTYTLDHIYHFVANEKNTIVKVLLELLERKHKEKENRRNLFSLR